MSEEERMDHCAEESRGCEEGKQTKGREGNEKHKEQTMGTEERTSEEG